MRHLRPETRAPEIIRRPGIESNKSIFDSPQELHTPRVYEITPVICTRLQSSKLDDGMCRFYKLIGVLFWALVIQIPGVAQTVPQKADPLVVGETFTINSRILGETRRINVYTPPGYGAVDGGRVPVLYMPDGGLAEDFLHIAGLVQVSVGNGTMRPFLLVGIENTQRRRDMTGPTDNAEDKKIAPAVGGSDAFRRFIRQELMPQVRNRYRKTDETAIIGESLAGLFVVETFLLKPDMFDTYIAIDPSLWWNDHKLVNTSSERLRGRQTGKKSLYFVSSEEKANEAIMMQFANILKRNTPPQITWHYEMMPEEKHSTIYHPAALKAFRSVFAVTPATK